MSFLSIDFETRSQVDLRKSGVYPYAEHPSTDVWCMSYAVPGSQPKTWFPGDPVPRVVPEVIRRGLPFRAWNASFEHIIWRDIMAPRYGFPAVPADIWWDTAAEAAALALPRNLAHAAQVLGLAQRKDEVGHKLMMKMCRPRAVGAWWITYLNTQAPRYGPFSTKGEADDYRRRQGWKPKAVDIWKDNTTVTWWDDPADIARLAQYCEDDVRTEMAVAEVMRPLSDRERQVYMLTQRMNDRGVGVDMQMVDVAADLNETAMQAANAQLVEITGGAVQGVTQVHSIREWCADHGVQLPDLRKDTVRDALNGSLALPNDVRTVLQIRQDAGKTSTAKLNAFEECVASDGRAHGLLMYHGASTGRWSGKLIQPQNFPRPTMDVDPLIPVIKGGGYDELLATGESVPNIIASSLRSMIIAAPGYELIAADFSQIEARVLAWIAGQSDLVQLFATGGKIYETMAAFIFQKAVHEITKDSFERQIGKNSILGAGFQMGADRFAEQVREQTGIVLDRGAKEFWCTKCGYVATLEYGEPKPLCRCGATPSWSMRRIVREDIADKAIRGYRTLYSNIPQFWYDIEAAAINAVLNPGNVYECGIPAKIKFMVRGEFLWCRLPSGRFLAYAKPEIVQRQLPEPNEHIWKDTLTFRGINTFTRQWGRVYSYGGHLTENVVQAMARDLMAEAMLRVEAAGYAPVLTVHDEVVCEQKKGEHALEDFIQLVSYVPSWAPGLPVASEGWVGERYRK